MLKKKTKSYFLEQSVRFFKIKNIQQTPVLLSLVILIFLFEKVLYPEYAVFVLFLKHQGVSRLFLEFLGFLAEKPSVLVFFQGALNFWRYGVVG